MADYTALQAAYTALIAELTDTLQAAQATAALADYISLRTAIADVEAGKVASYSIAGRSVTYRDPTSARDALRRAENDLHRIMGGCVTLSDVRHYGANGL